MARGNSRAESELSESLRAKARELRDKNEREKREAATNQKDYDDALKSAYMRAEEETDQEFRGMRMSVDEDEQAKRDAEANSAEEAAKAEEAREEAETAKNDEFVESVKKDLENYRSLSYDDWTGASWYRSVEGSDNPNVRGLEPNLWASDKDRKYLTDDYIEKSVKAAPAAIQEAVAEAMECWRANGRSDSYPGERAEKLYVGLLTAYRSGSKDGQSALTPELHQKGLQLSSKADAYIAKVLKGSSKHIVDADGNKV